MTTEKTITGAQLTKVRLALGLHRQRAAYRNLVAILGGDADWDALVERGLAIKIPGIGYRVTKECAQMVLLDGESISSLLENSGWPMIWPPRGEA